MCGMSHRQLLHLLEHCAFVGRGIHTPNLYLEMWARWDRRDKKEEDQVAGPLAQVT